MQGPAEPDEFRFRVPAVGLSAADMAISPDGTTIAMVARPGPGSRRRCTCGPVDAVTFRKLAGTDNASQPFWSPDSSSIGFVAGGRLKKVAAEGTPPQELGALRRDRSSAAPGAPTARSCMARPPASAASPPKAARPKRSRPSKNPKRGITGRRCCPTASTTCICRGAGETDKRAVVCRRCSAAKTRRDCWPPTPTCSTRRVICCSVAMRRCWRSRLTPPAWRCRADRCRSRATSGSTSPTAAGIYSVSQTGTLIYFQGAGGAGTGDLAHNRAGNTAGTIARAN